VTKKKERKSADDERNKYISHHWQHVVLPLDNRSSMCSSNVESSGFENRLFIDFGVLWFPYELLEAKNYEKNSIELLYSSTSR